jgi:hypothetical protein
VSDGYALSWCGRGARIKGHEDLCRSDRVASGGHPPLLQQIRIAGVVRLMKQNRRDKRCYRRSDLLAAGTPVGAGSGDLGWTSDFAGYI